MRRTTLAHERTWRPSLGVLAISDAERMFNQMLIDGRVAHGSLYILVGIREPQGTYLIVSERQIGNMEDWKDSYRTTAHSLAAMTARTGLPSRTVQLYHTDLLVDGDTVHWGSAIRGNVLATCCGIRPELAEFLSDVALGSYISRMLEQDSGLLENGFGQNVDRT